MSGDKYPKVMKKVWYYNNVHSLKGLGKKLYVNWCLKYWNSTIKLPKSLHFWNIKMFKILESAKAGP